MMKFIKKQKNDTSINDAIVNISTEIRLLREKLDEDAESLKGNVSEVSQRIVEGNEILREILLKMDDIRDEIKESTKPWYSRMACW